MKAKIATVQKWPIDSPSTYGKTTSSTPLPRPLSPNVPPLTRTHPRPNDSTEIFFLGIGDAFAGLANLLITKDRVYTRVSGVIAFVSENPVRAIASSTQTWLSKWYKENSLVFVSDQHTVFETENHGGRRPSKRYGNLRPVKERSLNEMVRVHRDETWQWILERCGSDGDETESER